MCSGTWGTSSGWSSRRYRYFPPQPEAASPTKPKWNFEILLHRTRQGTMVGESMHSA